MGSILRRLRVALGLEAPPAPRGSGPPTIRPMTYRDLSVVSFIERACFGSPWSTSSYSRAVSDPSQHFYVAMVDHVVVGYGGFWAEGRSAHIAKIAVHPEARRRGIGAALLERLLDEIRRVGLGRAFLEVRRSNLAAQDLYRRFGFRFERVQPHAYPDNGEDAFVFARDDLLVIPTPVPASTRREHG